MYKPSKVALQQTDYDILNAIRNDIGGMFRARTPLVKNLSDQVAYGQVVMGSGEFINQFTGQFNKIIDTWVRVRSYKNKLARFKRGPIGDFGEAIENMFVGYLEPEAFDPNPTSPGDVYAVKDPDYYVTYHPVNSRIVFRERINEDQLSLAFRSEGGIGSLRDTVVQRLYDSAEKYEWILMKWTLARAYLDNPSSRVRLPELNAANADAALTIMKEKSLDMTALSKDLNIYGVENHTPIDEQVFFTTNHSTAVIDVNAMAQAYNLSYKEFMGQRENINTFSFTNLELTGLYKILDEMVKNHDIPGYTEFTADELEALSHVQGAILDTDFFMIFDRLYATDSKYDELHRNRLLFLHTWHIYSYNEFANCIFFTDATAPSVSLKKTETVAVGSTVTLTATTIPEDAEVTWTSSDTTKATVENGVVTGVTAGTAKIKASISTVEGTAFAECTVTVTSE